LGLSLVHTNKTLSKLRNLQLANWGDEMLVVNDLGALANAAEMTLEPLMKRPIM